MLYRMKMTDEYIGVVVANDGQGITTIDEFPQLSEKSVEGLCWVLQRHGGTIWGLSNTGVAVPKMAEANLQGVI